MTTMTAALVAVLAQSPAAAPAPAAPLTPAQQISAAVQAAPEERRADATVMGYDESGKLVQTYTGKPRDLAFNNRQTFVYKYNSPDVKPALFDWSKF